MVLLVVAGVGGILFAVCGFAVSIFVGLDQLAMQGLTTLPILLAVAALTAAWSLARAPQRAAVGEQGIWLHYRNSRKRVAWDEIGWATVTAGGLNHQKKLVVYDTEGKTAATLSEAFEDFNELADLVTNRIDAMEDDTAERIQTKKAKRSAVLLIACSLGLFGPLAGSTAFMAREQQRADHLFESNAVEGTAKILSRHLAPNGVTKRLEYEITTPDGLTATRNAELTDDCWHALEDAQDVPVMYVPGQPKISRVIGCEPDRRDPLTDNPLLMYGLSGMIGVLSVFFLVVGVMQWRGWDIDLDSKTGRISIKRFGTGR